MNPEIIWNHVKIVWGRWMKGRWGHEIHDCTIFNTCCLSKVGNHCETSQHNLIFCLTNALLLWFIWSNGLLNIMSCIACCDSSRWPPPPSRSGSPLPSEALLGGLLCLVAVVCLPTLFPRAPVSSWCNWNLSADYTHGQAVLSPSHPTGTDRDRKGAQEHTQRPLSCMPFPIRDSSLLLTVPRVRCGSHSNLSTDS